MKKALLLVLACSVYSYCLSQERTVIDEDFESNHYNWKESDSDDFETKISKGVYQLKATGSNSKWSIIDASINPNEENFVVETQMELRGGPENKGYGLVFGMYNDWGNYKLFQFSGDGHYQLLHYYSNSYHTIIDWKKSPLVKSKNKLKIIRNFNCLEFILNDEKIETYCEFTWYGSKFGFLVSGEQKVAVDYLKLTASPKKVSVSDTSMAKFKKENIGPSVNGKYDENSPVISPDGKTLYYCLYYSPENTGDPNLTDVYYSQLQSDNTWGKYKSIGKPINNAVSNWVISVSPDNNSLVLGNTYKADGTSGGSGISIAKRIGDDKWALPVKQEIIDYVNNNKYSSYFISPDNKIMLLAMENETSYGNNDIYVSFLQAESRWSKPKNIGPVVNTKCQEFGPFMAADGRTLYFASYAFESYGSADIFMSQRLDDTWTNWSKPVNLGPSVNSSNWESGFSISARGDYAYLVSSEGGTEGSTDIFRIKLAESQKPKPVLLVYGKVLNKKTNEPLAANISYSDLTINKELGIATSNEKDGSYKIVLPAGKAYGFLATHSGYYPIAENIQLDTLKEYMEIERNLYLAPVEVGETIRLNNIFFDNNQATLKPESFEELDRLVKFLSASANVKIEIAGHTDNVGSDDYNQKLSQQRTESVVAYLVQKGIGKERLSAKGYGESKPVADNNTEEGKATNRRVEFFIRSK